MSDREAFYRAAIGPKNQAYYLSRFLAFDEAGRAGPSWNWAAALLTFFWFIYRRMWAVAFAYLVAANLLAWVIGIVFGVVGPLIALVVQIALPGLYGNMLYHAHCCQKIEEAKAAGSDPAYQLGVVEGSGGTSRAGAIIGFVLVGMVLLGMLAAVAIPQYQTYVSKARLAEAASLGRRAVESVEAYRRAHDELPAKLVEAGFIPTPPLHVYGIEMDGPAMVVTIRQGAGFPDGGRLIWELTESADGKTAWRCRAQRLPAPTLPEDCR